MITALEFSERVQNRKIKNGSKFEVYNDKNELVAVIGVIDSVVVYIEYNQLPDDILYGKYIYKIIQDNEKE